MSSDNLYVHELLQAVNTISAMLTNADLADYDEAIGKSLAILGHVAGVDRSYIWENFEQDGKIFCRQLWEWSEGAEPQQGKDFTISSCYDEMPIFRDAIFNGKTLNMPVSDMYGFEKEVLDSQDVKSILIIPIFHRGKAWGFVGFDDCKSERVFVKENEQALQSGGALIVSNILRYRMIQNLVEARENALASAHAKSEFLSRMSHELRTPMNAIVGMTKLAKKSDDLKTIRQYLSTAETSSAELLVLIDDVLDMSKIDSGKMGLERREFDFEKALRKTVGAARVKFDEKKIGFSVYNPQPFTCAFVGDERRVFQILANLLDNAAKFTPRQGAVSLKISHSQENVNSTLLRMEVTDNGCGIAPECIERIFQPFEQADSSLIRQHGGTGLGLAISKNLAELMGGSVSAVSEVGRGSTFTVELRLSRGMPYLSDAEETFTDNEKLTNADNQEHKKTAFDFHGQCVLLAEGIDVNRKLVALFLEEAGVTIDSAENGLQAVEMYKANPEKYRAILMDMQMPVLDGLSATRQIRASGLPNAKSIMIVAMTAKAFREEDEAAAFKAGMNKHIVKPIGIPELLKTLADEYSPPD